DAQGRLRVWFAQHAAARGYTAEVIARTWEIVDPRSKLPCSAALKRLTPHLAVCEEVPRHDPARPRRRTHREPL
ncbi:hypothetical protein, partial [Streptomyces albidoflavus]|uniref:hypothetical protein n=1 Tax=Streptomyces albidoflavus TaxID=1886 RepID=UPI0033F3DB62